MRTSKLFPRVFGLSVCMLLMGAIAQATPVVIDIGSHGTGTSDTWSWAGGAGSSLTSLSSFVTVDIVGGGGVPLLLPGSTLTFDSGPATGGTGKITDPFIFGAGGSIVVSGCGGVCFSGIFTGPQEAINFGNTLEFGGSITGAFNPLILALLGLPPGTPLTMEGALIENLTHLKPVTFPGGGVGKSGSGNITVAVPEPGSLMLLGSGLIGLFGWRKRAAVRA